MGGSRIPISYHRSRHPNLLGQQAQGLFPSLAYGVQERYILEKGYQFETSLSDRPVPQLRGYEMEWVEAFRLGLGI
jgi:hypothetical protein